MSKYRNHVTRLVNTPRPDIQVINNEKLHLLAEKTEKVCEMAAVMKEAVRMDEENCNLQQEVMARLVQENKVSDICCENNCRIKTLLSGTQRTLGYFSEKQFFLQS